MLLNHKSAIEFMVDAVPTEGITVPVIVDLQAKLMRDLLRDSRDIGSIRRRVVNIDGSVYTKAARSSAADIERALDAAHAAADKRGKTDAADRARQPAAQDRRPHRSTTWNCWPTPRPWTTASPSAKR